jgi:hypothetical protein
VHVVVHATQDVVSDIGRLVSAILGVAVDRRCEGKTGVCRRPTLHTDRTAIPVRRAGWLPDQSG